MYMSILFLKTVLLYMSFVYGYKVYGILLYSITYCNIKQ